MTERIRRVLVVDDDQDMRDVESYFLTREGYQVVAVESSAEAMKALARESFDIAVLDFDLGEGETGIKLAGQMRAAGHDVPAIMLTAMAGDTAVVGALRSGLRDFVRKGEGFLKQLGEAIPRVLTVVEQERAEREREARAQSEKVLDRFAEGLSHNLNNMLGAVIGFSELELRRHEEGSRTRQALERILDGGLRAASVVKQLAAASQRQHAHPDAVSLAHKLTKAEEVLRSLNRPGIAVHVRAEPGLAFALVDSDHADQIVYNLIIRACDAMTDVGTLRLVADNVRLPEGAFVRLVVEDSGPAPTEEMLRHAFEPFHEVKAERHGSGLELAAVYGFVQVNGGKIAIRRSEKGGTQVEVLLRRAD